MGKTGPERDAVGTGRSSERPAEITAELVLNAAVAFAGHVASAAEQAAEKTGGVAEEAIRMAILRQYQLETATLCLRRLSDSYTDAGADPAQAGAADVLRDGAERARAATSMSEALSDLGLDLLDRLLAPDP